MHSYRIGGTLWAEGALNPSQTGCVFSARIIQAQGLFRISMSFCLSWTGRSIRRTEIPEITYIENKFSLKQRTEEQQLEVGLRSSKGKFSLLYPKSKVICSYLSTLGHRNEKCSSSSLLFFSEESGLSYSLKPSFYAQRWYFN